MNLSGLQKLHLCEWVYRPANHNYQCPYCKLISCKPIKAKCLNQEDSPERVSYLGSPKETHIIKFSECAHIGLPYDDEVEVEGCGCSSAVAMSKVFECAIHGECTPLGKAVNEPDLQACKDCKQYQHKGETMS